MLNESRVENERQGKCVSFGNPTTASEGKNAKCSPFVSS